METKTKHFDNNPETRKERRKREAEDDFERERKVWKVLRESARQFWV